MSLTQSRIVKPCARKPGITKETEMNTTEIVYQRFKTGFIESTSVACRMMKYNLLDTGSVFYLTMPREEASSPRARPEIRPSQCTTIQQEISRAIKFLIDENRVQRSSVRNRNACKFRPSQTGITRSKAGHEHAHDQISSVLVLAAHARE